MGLAIDVQNRGIRVGSEAKCAALVGHAGDGNLLFEIDSLGQNVSFAVDVLYRLFETVD